MFADRQSSQRRLTNIIYTHGAGRLANQLHCHAHLLAFCLEHAPRFSLFNAALVPYAAFLPRGAESFGAPATWLKTVAEVTSRPSVFHLPLLLAARAAWRIFSGHAFDWRVCLQRLSAFHPSANIIYGEGLDLDNAAEQLGASRVVVLSGWTIRGHRLFEKHRREIMRRLALTINQPLVESILRRAQSDSDLLIGVHVRQSDYAEFEYGAHFFSTPQYAAAMKSITDAVTPCRVSFVVCSDTQQAAREFQGLNATVAVGTTAADDLTLLSLCDGIIGPHSTFNHWAAFMGDAILIWLELGGKVPPAGMDTIRNLAFHKLSYKVLSM